MTWKQMPPHVCHTVLELCPTNPEYARSHPVPSGTEFPAKAQVILTVSVRLTQTSRFGL